MTAAVIFVWASCLWSIVRSLLWLMLRASPWRRMLVLAVLALAASSCRSPQGSSFQR